MRTFSVHNHDASLLVSLREKNINLSNDNNSNKSIRQKDMEIELALVFYLVTVLKDEQEQLKGHKVSLTHCSRLQAIIAGKLGGRNLKQLVISHLH